MARITYEIVQHDGGWAYRVDGVYSETFPSRERAVEAAHQAAGEQMVPGDATDILFESENSVWRREHSSGDDRPQTDVAD